MWRREIDLREYYYNYEEKLNFNNLIDQKYNLEEIEIQGKINDFIKHSIHKEDISVFEEVQLIYLLSLKNNFGKIYKIIKERLTKGFKFSEVNLFFDENKIKLDRDEKLTLKILKKINSNTKVNRLIELYSFYLTQYLTIENKELFINTLDLDFNKNEWKEFYLSYNINHELLAFWSFLIKESLIVIDEKKIITKKEFLNHYIQNPLLLRNIKNKNEFVNQNYNLIIESIENNKTINDLYRMLLIVHIIKFSDKSNKEIPKLIEKIKQLNNENLLINLFFNHINNQ